MLGLGYAMPIGISLGVLFGCSPQWYVNVMY